MSDKHDNDECENIAKQTKSPTDYYHSPLISQSRVTPPTGTSPALQEDSNLLTLFVPELD